MKLSSTTYLPLLSKAILGLLLIWGLSSCQRDEGEEDFRLNWSGTWTCNEVEGFFAPQVYAIEIEEYGDEDWVRLEGLYGQGSGFFINAIVGEYTMTIPEQQVDGFTFSGTGNLNGSIDHIEFYWTVDDGSGDDLVSGFMSR